MDAIDLTDPEPVEDSRLDHRLPARAILFRRLEDQRHRPGEIPRLGQVPGSPEQHGDMPVMAAGMHSACNLRGVFGPGHLGNRQRIHIGPEPDHRPRPPAPDQRDNPGLRNVFMHFVHADLAQLPGDPCGGLRAIERKLGILVQVPPPALHFLGISGDTVQNGHGGLLTLPGTNRKSKVPAMPRPTRETSETPSHDLGTDLVHDPDGGLPRLVEIMARLRNPEGGCPWDLEQSFASIAPYTLEEAHEVADAIAEEDWGGLKGELGDLLFQVIFHARMAEEAGLFALPEVIRAISDKMVSRHPHVFGDESRDKSAEQQTRDWEKIKAAERAETGARVLDGVALALPALTRAVKLQNRAARVGFDWPSTMQVLEKLQEETEELVEAREELGAEELEEEMGDMLFVMANLARHLKIDPEAALRSANAKFSRRFARIENWLAEAGKTPDQSDLTEMDALWNRAKAEDKAAKTG